MFNVIKKIRSSIFKKLILVLIAANVITIMVVVELFENYIEKQLIAFQHNVTRYTDYLIAEIGTPPDTLKARKLSQELSVKIRYEGTNVRWSSHEDIPSFQDYDRQYVGGNKFELNAKKLTHGIWSISKKNASARYLFAFDVGEMKYYRKLLGGLLIVILTLIFTVSYFLIRWMLKPINWLAEGVEQISKEKLSHQVRLRGFDELGVLTGSFNSMTKRIREMIRSKEQLLLDVSHELRSPLTRIKVALESIPQDKTKQSIQEDLAEVESMITEILECERLNSSHGKLYLAEACISNIITEVAGNYKEKLPGVKLISIPENLFLKIDLDRAKTVLRNVLENSIKYSTPHNQPIEISVEEEEKFVVLKVKDFGSGIPKAELPYIFEPFYRIDKSRSKNTGGYGLGLSLCKKIMEAHGGTIEINSIPDEGTTVLLKFPK